MKTSANMRSAIKILEGVRLDAYQDSVGIWTIGVGHTGPEVHAGLKWTLAQVDAALSKDFESAEAAVNQLVRVPLTQSMFDALASLVFNIGTGRFKTSTLLRMLNARDYAGAQQQFARWCYAGGVMVPGLAKRRETEAAIFGQEGLL